MRNRCGVFCFALLFKVSEKEDISFENDEEVKGNFWWFKRRLRGTFRSFRP